MDRNTLREVRINPEDFRRTYIETRERERDLLRTLEAFYKEVSKKGSANKHEGELMDGLDHYYHEWQQTPIESPFAGLDKGGNGAIFTRWVALGILEDMPEVFVPEEKQKDVIKYLDVSKSESKNSRVVVEIPLSLIRPFTPKPKEFVRFRFNTSLSEIRSRIEKINIEMGEMKRSESPYKV